MSENNQLLMEVKCTTFTRCRVYQDRIEIKPLFGEQVIPKSKVNAIQKNWANVITIKTIGGEDYQLSAWDTNKGKELYELLKNWHG